MRAHFLQSAVPVKALHVVLAVAAIGLATPSATGAGQISSDAVATAGQLPGPVPGFVGEIIQGTYTIGERTGAWQALPVYVTSDGSATHATSAGAPVAGLNHDGVSDMIISTGSGSFRCSGALLYDGQSILTAAHCVTDNSGNINASNVSATWELSGGTVTASSSTIQVHPSYNGSVTNGYDVAVINFSSPIDAAVPRYGIFRDGGLVELGPEIIKVGYGRSGFGETGATTGSGTKRYGKNEWEDDGLGDEGVGGITNDSTQVTYDFDSNYRNLDDDGGKDATDDEDHDGFNFHFGRAVNLGFGDDEVMSGAGDSGSPSFILDDGEYRIAGVASYILRLERSAGPPGDRSSDVDDTLNSSWGEFAVDSRLAEPAMSAFVDSAVIPEPATLALLAAGGLGVLLRRQRRN